MNNIQISELNKTKQSLQRIADKLKSRLEVAEKMVCTEETKQAVKKYRTDLKKEFEELETERKEKTREYEKPLEEFKTVYNELITKPYKAADQALKNKIDEVEALQKSEKRQAVESYATELIQSYALDWLESSRIMPNVTLSVSEKSLKKEVKDKVEKIKSEIDCINAISDNSELMAEYMNCLNLAQAKLTVVERQHAIEAAEKAKAAYTQNEEVNRQAEEKVDMLAPPVIEEEKPEEKKYTMTFTVSGTIEQLKTLKSFMIENNIEFKNGGNNNE